MTVVPCRCGDSDRPEPERRGAGWTTLWFVRHGVETLRAPAGTLLADPNQIVILPPMCGLQAEPSACRGERCGVVLRFPAALAEGLAGRPASSSPGRGGVPRVVSRTPRASVELEELLAATAAAHPDVSRVEELALRLLDRAAGALPAEDARPSSDERHRLICGSKALLNARLAEPLALVHLAGQLHCSRWHLSRIFKRATGLTLTRYLHRLRVHEAVRRLADGVSDLTDLALDLGYASHSHFTFCFRRSVGSTPSSVRERLRSARAG